MSVALPSGPRPARLLTVRGLPWWALALVVAVLTARLTMASIQLGCAVALVVLTVGLYVRNRTAGLVAVWIIWLLAPFLRRIFLLSEPIQAAEPLALVPFLVTAAVVAMELTQVRLSRRAWRLLRRVVVGYAVGLPLGLLLFPPAALFALFAYLTAAGCFVIGYREAEQRTLVLPTVLMIVTPLLALYAFRQYYLPLPSWDFIWQRSADINSIGSPENGRIRVWSTLNSPGTFALVLGVATLALVMWRRVTPLRLVGALAVLGALALTYVRSAWVATLLASVVVVAVTRGAGLKRVAPVVVVLAALAPVALAGSTGAALTERANTFGALGQDESANERVGTRAGVLAFALRNPIGSGLGTAGEATRLGGGGFRYTDNGYLSLMIQVGPVAFLVVMSVVIAAVASAWRNAWRHAHSTDVLAFGVLFYFAVMLLAGDQLFGIGGMIFWYMSGLAMRRRELYEGSST